MSNVVDLSAARKERAEAAMEVVSGDVVPLPMLIELAGLSWKVCAAEATATDAQGHSYRVWAGGEHDWRWELAFQDDSPVANALSDMEDQFGVGFFLRPCGDQLPSIESAMKEAAGAKRYLNACAKELAQALGAE